MSVNVYSRTPHPLRPPPLPRIYVRHAERFGGVRAVHEPRGPADDAVGEAAAEGLPVADHVSLHVKVLLRAARGEAEAGVDLVEDEDDAGVVADSADILQELLVL